MNLSYDVKFFEISRNRSSKTPSYVVRWSVARKRSSKTYRTKALAESFLSDLRQAAKRGEAFEVETGLPQSMIKAKDARTVLEFVTAFIEMKWPHAAAKTRDGMSDALATILPALTKDPPAVPTPKICGRLFASTSFSRRAKGRPLPGVGTGGPLAPVGVARSDGPERGQDGTAGPRRARPPPRRQGRRSEHDRS